jgi:hypothetical protein
VFVETCDDLIAQENDELKQDVEKLKRDLYVLKEESQVQPSQDNRDDMVKKLEKGSTDTSSTPQQHIKIIKGNIQEKKTGHGTPHCPTKLKAQETIFKKKRRSTRAQGSRNNLQEEKKVNQRKIVLHMQRKGSLGYGLHTS